MLYSKLILIIISTKLIYQLRNKYWKEFKIEISGVGKLDATEFKAKNCKAEVSGVAKISVYAEELLEAEVSGMGKINYAGKPVVRANSSGIGKINKL